MSVFEKVFYCGIEAQQLQTEKRKIFILNIWNFTVAFMQIPYIAVALTFLTIYDAVINIAFALLAIICYVLSYQKRHWLAYSLIIFIYPILLTLIFWRFGEGKNVLMLFVVLGLAVPFFFDNIKVIVFKSLYVVLWAFIASNITFSDFLLRLPATATYWFAALNLGLSIILAVMFVTVLIRENLRFERNIIRQNEQLKTQKEEIESQKNYLFELHEKLSQKNVALQESNEIIQHRNQTIADSIQYAQRIQKSILPLDEYVKSHLPEYFIFFQPRDVISGDFYYFEEKNGKHILAAIDCTGHGIPGALMTMLGAETLNEIILNRGITAPDLILNELHKKIRKTLKQAETENRDGMDLALLTIDHKDKKAEYAGAKNPLIYIQNNEIYLIKADKMPIGGEQREAERVFTKYEISISTPTMFYLFSDGFQDQFGGEQNKKFGIARMKNLFLEIHALPLSIQQQKLREVFDTWRKQGGEKQIDDVLVIGVRL